MRHDKFKDKKPFKNYYTWVNLNCVKFNNLREHRVVPEFILSLNRLVKKFNHKNIVLDVSDVLRVSPSPIVPIAGYIDYFKSQGISFELKGASSYLLNTSLMSPLIPDEQTIKNTRSFFDKVWVFNNSTDVFNLTNGIISSIRKSIECENGVIDSCEWGIYEIMDNVIQHSETKRGFVMVQVNKKSNSLNICIFDYGVGIYRTMLGTTPNPRNPIDAISLSVQEGKKGAKSVGQGNGMWGLYNIVNNNLGHLTIISGTGGIFYNDNKAQTFKDIIVLNYKQQATAVNFHLNLNKETLITNAIKGHTFVDLYSENKEDSFGRIVFKINDVASGTGTRESAIEIRNELINLYTVNKKTFIIDF